MLQRLQVTAHITGIAILRDQFQRHLLTAATNQDWNVGLLYTLWLINRTTHVVILPFKGRLFLLPHSVNDLEGFAQLAQTLRRIGKGIAIRSIFMLIPTRPDAKVQATMAQHIESTRHLRQPGRLKSPKGGKKRTISARMRKNLTSRDREEWSRMNSIP